MPLSQLKVQDHETFRCLKVSNTLRHGVTELKPGGMTGSQPLKRKSQKTLLSSMLIIRPIREVTLVIRLVL